ncbi:MAG: hypothetical protein N3B01_00735 [Verrucomicrobiae bacterium]|nr:hypothetical protein [Verrucomicrobiae bacterium]
MNWQVRCVTIVWLLCAPLNAGEQPNLAQKHLEQLFLEAVMLSQAGLYEEAETRCRKILSQMPNQPTVKQLLDEIQQKKLQRGKPDPAAELKKRLGSIVLPEVHFREAAVTDVVEFLRQETKKYTPDKTEINFVLMLPAGDIPKVTLTLRKVPLSELLRYIGILTGLQYRVDPYAVVLSPAPSLTPLAQPDAKAR